MKSKCCDDLMNSYIATEQDENNHGCKVGEKLYVCLRCGKPCEPQSSPAQPDAEIDKEIGLVLCKYGCMIGDCEKDTYECNREFKQTLDKLYLKKFVEKLEKVKKAGAWIDSDDAIVLWSDILNLK